MLSALARAEPPNLIWITLMICGIITAAEPPWTNRETMSTALRGASPQAGEASVKPRAPIEYIRRRPNMSPSRAPVMSNIA
jgi:hypothetical protein